MDWEREGEPLDLMQMQQQKLTIATGMSEETARQWFRVVQIIMK